MTKNVENTILELLLPGPKGITSFVETITTTLHVSPQAVYKSIRKLKDAETVTIYKKQIALSLVWINKQKERFVFAEYSYKASKDILANLSEQSRRVTFPFSNYADMDLFWAHVYDIISESLKTNPTRYFIIPHDFFLYGRYETDAYWIAQFFNKETKTRFLLTHPLLGDKVVIKERNKSLKGIATFHQNVNPFHQENNIYYNLLGDYIFKATFDKKINEKIESFIKKVSKLPLIKSEEKEIEEILSTKGRFTLTIERNQKKTLLMEKKLKKYFE